MAAQLCAVDPESGTGCAWYHGVWQDLRVLGLASSPERQAGFFLKAFGRWRGRTGPLRILITGAADYGILAQLLRACTANAVTPAFTVVDACETPLYLNRWYAERQNLRIATIRCNLLNEAPAGHFDVVCSHSFIGLFPADQRTTIAARWRDLLDADGVVLAVNRVRETGTAPELKFSAEEAREFRQSLRERARESCVILQTTPEELAARAERYIERQYACPLSEADLAGLFESAGLRIGELSLMTGKAAREGAAGGPGVPGSTRHACIVAAKA
jgi:hypothetical protein